MMRSLLVIALFAGTAYAEPSETVSMRDPFATARPAESTVAPEPAPTIEPAKVNLRVVNDPQAVTYRDTFHRRTSRVVLGVGMMVVGLASIFVLGPVGLPVIGVGFAVTVTAPLDRERVQAPPSRTQVGLAFSGRF